MLAGKYSITVILILIISLFLAASLSCSSNKDEGYVGDKYMNITVSPYLHAKPGDELKIKVEVGTGYNTELVKIELIPDQNGAPQWPRQTLYEGKASFPSMMSESSLNVHVTDSKTIKVMIPEFAVLPLDIEVKATYKYTKPSGGTSFYIASGEKTRKITLGQFSFDNELLAASITSANVSWSYSDIEKDYVVEQVQITLQNESPVPWAITAATFWVGSLSFPWINEQISTVQPGENNLTYDVFIPAKDNEQMTITFYADPKEESTELTWNFDTNELVNQFKVAEYQFTLTKPILSQ